MTRIYSVADNSNVPLIVPQKLQNPTTTTNITPALSLRSSSTASMLPKPRRVVTTRSSGWDTPRISQQQRTVMQLREKQAKQGKMMQRLFGHRLVPGFLK